MAGSPPKSAETILPQPVATSSILERCFLPIIPSATTAESKLSIPAKKAIVKAGLKSLRTISKFISGKCGVIRPVFISPKVLPMVATGKSQTFTIIVVITNAAKEPGKSLSFFGQNTIRAKASAPISKVGTEVWAKLWKYKFHLAKKAEGISVRPRPKKSLICVENSTTAIPLVKPVVTG